jgi:hypothetical protein
VRERERERKGGPKKECGVQRRPQKQRFHPLTFSFGQPFGQGSFSILFLQRIDEDHFFHFGIFTARPSCFVSQCLVSSIVAFLQPFQHRHLGAFRFLLPSFRRVPQTFRGFLNGEETRNGMPGVVASKAVKQ